MGPIAKRFLQILPGWIACVGALTIGAEIAFVAAAMILYALASPLPPVPRTVLLLIAPLVLATGASIPTLLSLSALLWVAIGLLSAAPLYLFLGGKVPLLGPALWIPLTTLLLAPIPFLKFAPSYFTSDIATRAQLVFLAAACILLSGLLPLIRLPGTHSEATERTYVPLLSGDAKVQSHVEDDA